MKIDLGGIAKGFALDCAIKKLKEHNINNCLINAGGQVYALGDKLGKPCKIAIKDPRQPGISGTLELNNQSVSTSGDYEQFFLKNGKRYCHIIDPKTGYPADTQIFSVTVIANDGLTADALSLHSNFLNLISHVFKIALSRCTCTTFFRIVLLPISQIKERFLR